MCILAEAVVLGRRVGPFSSPAEGMGAGEFAGMMVRVMELPSNGFGSKVIY